MTTELTNEQVATFLRDHEDFFNERADLLELLRLPDPRGEAVSLLERQAQVLRERNGELRERLNQLVDIARENDRLFEKTRKMVLRLLEAKTLPGLIDSLCQGLKQEFSPDTIGLLIYQQTELKLKEPHAQVRCLPLGELPEALQSLLQSGRAICGALRPKELEQLFPVDHAKVKSAAMVPLFRHQPQGLLAIGSFEADHFKSSLGTLFISHIGEVLSRRLADFLPTDGNSQARRA